VVDPSANESENFDALDQAVNAALARFFGPDNLFSCTPVAGRKSARGVFKVSASGRQYALRLSNTALGATAWQSEVEHARLASDAGVGPYLHLAQPELALTLTDWIEPSAVTDGLAAVVKSLRILHACPVQRSGLNMLEWLGEQASEAVPKLPAGPVRDALSQWDELRASVQPVGARAPCHQDPHPANICFSGGRAWFIDWESAGAGDPFFDLASIANWFLCEGPLLRGCCGNI
jgi:Ser/Thr protein kinase RdoA (MazF antagonist)